MRRMENYQGHKQAARKRPPIRPPLRYFGGKYYLAQQIIEHFPDSYRMYVEPYAGAASVLLNKPPAADYYNDLDECITRLFRVLRDHGPELTRRLQLSPYSVVEFNRCCEPPPVDADEIEMARRDFIRWRMSRDGNGRTLATPAKRERRGIANNVAGFLSTIDEELPKIADRLRQVEILCRPALEVIEQLDSPKTLFYLDPPYPHQTRSAGARDVYKYEMTDDEHRTLAERLRSIEGKAIISSYPSRLYAELYEGWRLVEIEKKRDVGTGPKKTVTECLWLNY